MRSKEVAQQPHINLWKWEYRASLTGTSVTQKGIEHHYTQQHEGYQPDTLSHRRRESIAKEKGVTKKGSKEACLRKKPLVLLNTGEATALYKAQAVLAPQSLLSFNLILP